MFDTNDYISETSLSTDITHAYIDTGVVPTNKITIEAYFGGDAHSAIGFVFGARNTNSSTSAGQLNCYIGASGSSSYIGYNNNRVAKTITAYNSRFHVSNVGNDFALVRDNMYTYELLGATGTFTGTKNIFLFGLNNGGTLTAPVGGDLLTFYGCKIYEDDALIRNFVPVREVATGNSGMYDLVNDVFYGSAGTGAFYTDYQFLVETDETDGGVAYLKMEGGYVKRQYASYVSTGIGRDYLRTPVTAVAQANEGYVFTHWEINGENVSNDEEYTFQPTEAVTVKAVFAKEAAMRNSLYNAMILKYDVGSGSVYDSKKSASYVNVVSGTVTEDLLQRSTSTFVCEEIPDSVQINTPVFLYDAKGKIVYYGVVKTINGNELECREPISLYDDEARITPSMYKSTYTTLYGAYQYLQLPDKFTGWGFVRDRMTDLYPLAPSEIMSVDPDKVPRDAMPVISETSIENVEDILLNAYSELGVICKYGLYEYEYISPIDRTTYFMSVTPSLANDYDTITIGSDLECISDVSITTKEAESTVVQIYNSTGETYRGEALMRTDGTIEIFEAGASMSGLDSTRYVAKTLCKRSVVFSDDNIKTISLENLNGSLYSHKITFKLHRSYLLRFSQLHLGQRVDFYHEGRIYNSAITAWTYEIMESGQINSMNITLGNVRTTLTAILNKKSKKR